jgi:hypothetical protein
LNINKYGIVVFLIVLAVLVGPVSAVNWNVNNTSDIQGTINGASEGDTINFTSDTGDTYTGFAVSVTKNNLNFFGNGVTLVGGGSSIFKITNRTGLTIKDFIININNDTADGITGNNVYDCTIENNVITNGDDGINIYQRYAGLTIRNNTINNVDRDGISLVNHDNLTDEAFNALDPTTIEDNVIQNVVYGIFLGGNFKGDITGNTIGGTTAGLTITGKATTDNGKLNATISNNNITGIAMECPRVLSLILYDNVISQLGATGYSILTNGNFGHVSGAIWVVYNQFSAPVDVTFRNSAYAWILNFLNGAYYP